MTPTGDHVEGASTFHIASRRYDEFMGRYSRPLAVKFADLAQLDADIRVLDLGCGTGALTDVLTRSQAATSVSACDPSPPFVAECSRRNPEVMVRQGSAEAILFEDDAFDAVLTQLVLHFVTDPETAVAELTRVLRPGGTVAGCVWDAVEGMQMLSYFWKAALNTDPVMPAKAQELRFGAPGEMVGLLEAGGFDDLAETTTSVSTTYEDFDELWAGFLAGIGPAGAYCAHLPEDAQMRLRSELLRSLGSPGGSFSLDAVARCVVGRAPSPT